MTTNPAHSEVLSDLARVRAQFQMEAIMKAMGVKQYDIVRLDNQHKDGVESRDD
jgi:hypothetical protein